VLVNLSGRGDKDTRQVGELEAAAAAAVPALA
jgi:tryptophan synthase beta subunit